MMRCFHYQRQRIFSPFSLSSRAFPSPFSLSLTDQWQSLSFSPFSLSSSTRLVPKFCCYITFTTTRYEWGKRRFVFIKTGFIWKSNWFIFWNITIIPMLLIEISHPQCIIITETWILVL
jgi:hypothetical protein